MPGLELCIWDLNFAKPDASNHAQRRQVPDPVEKSNRNLARERSQMKVLTSARRDRNIVDLFVYSEPCSFEGSLEHQGQPAKEEEESFIMVATNILESVSVRASGLDQLTELGRGFVDFPWPCVQSSTVRVQAC